MTRTPWLRRLRPGGTVVSVLFWLVVALVALNCVIAFGAEADLSDVQRLKAENLQLKAVVTQLRHQLADREHELAGLQLERERLALEKEFRATLSPTPEAQFDWGSLRFVAPATKP